MKFGDSREWQKNCNTSFLIIFKLTTRMSDDAFDRVLSKMTGNKLEFQ